MAPTLIQLETFCRVARLGNFTRAADELHLTQSAVTQQLKALQAKIAVPLFEFKGRRAVLTDGGAFLLERATALLNDVAALERDLHEFASARAGVVEFGATLTIGNYALPAQIAAFRNRAPAVELRPRVANTRAVCDAVKARELAFALVEGTVADATLLVEGYATDRLVLIAPARGHRFSKRPSLAIEDLAGEDVVAREEGSGTRAQLEDALRLAGVVTRSRLSFPSNEGVVRAVEAGLGVALVSQLCIDLAVAARRIVRIELQGVRLERRLSIVRSPVRVLSPAARAFLDFLRGV